MIKGPNAGTLEGLKPALNTPVPIFEDFHHQCFRDLSGGQEGGQEGEGISKDPSSST